MQRRAGRIVAALFIGLGLLVGLDTVVLEWAPSAVFVPLLLAADLLSIGVGTLLMLSAADR